MKSGSITKDGRILQPDRERKLSEPNIALSPPRIIKGNWTKEEDAKLTELQALYGNKWAKILLFFPYRTKRSIRHRCFRIKSAKISKAVKSKVTVLKASPSPKLITIREDKYYSNLMMRTSAMQTASNSNVKLMRPSGMSSKTKAVNSLRQKDMKKIATSESCLAFKHTSQKTENVQQRLMHSMNEPNSVGSSYVAQGLVHKHVDDNASFIDTLNNHIDATNRIIMHYSGSLASPYTSAHHMNRSEENILMEKSSDEINSVGSSYVARGLVHKHVDNNASFIDTLNNHIDATNRIVMHYSGNLASPYTSAHHTNRSEENILIEKSSDVKPCGSIKSTSTTKPYGDANDIPPTFDPESFAHAIAYATSLINA